MKEAIFNGIWGDTAFNFGNELHRTEMISDKNFSYGHYKVNDGMGTVAGFRMGDKLYFSVALCSPCDNFSKAEGRYIAEENLIDIEHSSKRGVMILDKTAAELHPAELLKLALEHHLNRMIHKPIWAKNPVVDFRPVRRRSVK